MCRAKKPQTKTVKEHTAPYEGTSNMVHIYCNTSNKIHCSMSQYN